MLSPTVRRRLSAAVAVLTLTSSGAIAQVEEGAAACHAMVDDVARLACYDDLTDHVEDAGSDPAAEQATPIVAPLDSARETALVRRFVVAVGALNLSSAKDVLEPSDVLPSLSEEARTTMEVALLDEIRPLPASQTQTNLDGYRLLALLKPDNATYVGKVAQYEGALQAQRDEALRSLESERDDFRSITFYHHRNEPAYIDIRSRIGLYIADPDAGRPHLRVKTVYTEDSWLWVRDVQVSIDGRISRFTSGEFLHDNDSEIWEWRDEVPTATQISLLREMAQADTVTMRFNGNPYYDEKTLSAEDRRMIRDVLIAYDEMLSSQG